MSAMSPLQLRIFCEICEVSILLATKKKCVLGSLHSRQDQNKLYLDLNAMVFLSKMWILKKKINLAKHHYMTELPRSSPESNIHDL